MKTYIIIIILISIFSIVSISFLLQENYSAEFENGKNIYLELAVTENQKSQGLMNRKNLGENEGMLFIFDEESILNFWMKETLLPLDIIFLDKYYKITNIKTMQPCSEDPCPSYSSENKSKYAIEVNAGFTEENNISIGQNVFLIK